MGSQGFKGTDVGIERVTVEGIVAKVEAQFVGEDGTVHGITRSTLNWNDDPPLKEAVLALVNLVRDRVTEFHFTDPENPTSRRETRRGIAEALAGGSPDHSDGFEDEG